MFFILNDAKSFMNAEYSAIHSSAMAHPYKWATTDMLYGKNIFSTVGHSCNEL